MGKIIAMDNNPKKLFGENVRRLRKNRYWSHEKLAEACGLHRTYIGAIERGERNVSLENIVEITRSLDVSPSALLKGVS